METVINISVQITAVISHTEEKIDKEEMIRKIERSVRNGMKRST